MNILMPAINTYLKRCICAKLSTVDTQLSQEIATEKRQGAMKEKRLPYGIIRAEIGGLRRL